MLVSVPGPAARPQLGAANFDCGMEATLDTVTVAGGQRSEPYATSIPVVSARELGYLGRLRKVSGTDRSAHLNASQGELSTKLTR